MSHPRIEEVSDSDPEMVSDPEEVDLDDFNDNDIMRRVEPKPSTSSSSSAQKPKPSPATAAHQAMMQQMMLDPANTRSVTAEERGSYAAFQSLYPVYFDASRTRAQGRRVSAALAVHSPLAREIAAACSHLRLQTVLEPDKTHPKDWSNPGRVKVALKPARGGASKTAGGGGGGGSNHAVANKHHLYILVAQHLRENPTTERSPGLRVRIGGQIQPPEDKPYPRPAAPRGWKISEFVPYTSAAMTGGGVSENLFKDIMKEMQGGSDPMSALMASQAGAMAGGSGGGGGGSEDGAKKKKDKKKDKKKGRA